MFSISFDFSDFERAAKEMQAAVDQVPFAIANAMNKAAFDTRKELVGETWPKHVKARKKSFLSASLRVNKASKRRLQVTLFDGLQHADLERLETGGQKTARGDIAIPTANVRRGAGGVSKAQKPSALANSFKVPGKKGGSVIYQRRGKGKRQKLKLMYVLRPQAQIKPAVPFHEDFERAFTWGMKRYFPFEMRRAMQTRRRRR